MASLSHNELATWLTFTSPGNQQTWYLPCRIKKSLFSFRMNVNTFRPRQNGRHFAAAIFQIFLYENTSISINISLKSVPRGPVNNIAALVQIMAWRRPGDKPLSETMMIILLTHICVTRPQWVKYLHHLTAEFFHCPSTSEVTLKDHVNIDCYQTSQTHHYSHVTWVLGGLKSPATQQFVQQLAHGNNTNPPMLHVSGPLWGDSLQNSQLCRKSIHIMTSP